ncbi:MAG: Dabb family protein, partial [Clostridia bacterium]|nr:Dabb family protein [Clostridia bacterium]
KLEEYQKDPYHVNVVKKYMHEHVETSIAVDYEID